MKLVIKESFLIWARSSSICDVIHSWRTKWIAEFCVNLWTSIRQLLPVVRNTTRTLRHTVVVFICLWRIVYYERESLFSNIFIVTVESNIVIADVDVIARDSLALFAFDVTVGQSWQNKKYGLRNVKNISSCSHTCTCRCLSVGRLLSSMPTFTTNAFLDQRCVVCSLRQAADVVTWRRSKDRDLQLWLGILIRE